MEFRYRLVDLWLNFGELISLYEGILQSWSILLVFIDTLPLCRELRVNLLPIMAQQVLFQCAGPHECLPAYITFERARHRVLQLVVDQVAESRETLVGY